MTRHYPVSYVPYMQQRYPQSVYLFAHMDPAKDQDDLLADGVIAMLASQFFNLVASSATLKPSYDRARVQSGALISLGMPDVPVGIGADMVDIPVNPREFDLPFMHERPSLTNGEDLLVNAIRSARHRSLTLVITGGMTDVARAFERLGPELPLRLARVIMQSEVAVNPGGTAMRCPLGYLVPGDASNNNFDMRAAQAVFYWCQHYGIPLEVVSRHTASAAAVPASVMAQLRATGHPVAVAVADTAEERLNDMWRRTWINPKDDPDLRLREKLAPRCTPAWVLRDFCGHSLDLKDISFEQAVAIAKDLGFSPDVHISEHVKSYKWYDALVPLIADYRYSHLWAPQIEVVYGVPHKIYGITPDRHGMVDPDAVRDLLVTCAVEGFAKHVAQGEAFVEEMESIRSERL
jgi:inosine-uridine nucleoside N-ribohydrolase